MANSLEIYIKLTVASSFMIYLVYLFLDNGFITKEKDKPSDFEDIKFKGK